MLFLKNAGYIRIPPLATATIFIVLVVSFFYFYNMFLVDRSIESLQFSLSEVSAAETTGSVSYLNPLMQLQFVDELS